MSFPFLPQNDLAHYRVTGPNGQGPFEVQAHSLLEAARIATEHAPAEFGGITGLSQPQGQHGQVFGYKQVLNSRDSAEIGPFDIAFLSWAE